MSVSDRWRPQFPARSGTDMARMHLRLIPSMRTIGNEVNDGRLRRWSGQPHRSGIDGCRAGCCTLVLHRLKPSRVGQTKIASVSGKSRRRSCFRISRMSCGEPSASVRWYLSPSTAIVTQLVTQSP
jgi:hypothetical protein